jgi:hypothetical protein
MERMLSELAASPPGDAAAIFSRFGVEAKSPAGAEQR